jgi:hypothetical protein
MKDMDHRPAQEPEPRVPTDLRKALAATPEGRGCVEGSHADRAEGLHHLDRRSKQPETHTRRIEKACSMLAAERLREDGAVLPEIRADIGWLELWHLPLPGCEERAASARLRRRVRVAVRVVRMGVKDSTILDGRRLSC